jgi:DnaJ domain
MAQTYYEILGVPENATAAEIEAAFKAKAREVHPDTVPAENTYLRQVAAEAFKDLSEAKTVLLDPIARQKYDGGLEYARSSEPAQPDSSSTPPSTQGSSQSGASAHSRTSGRAQRSSRSRTSPAGAQAGAARRARRAATPFPDIKNLNSFLFMILGAGTIFFLVVLVWDDRTPPLWLAALTACLGILSFVNGMRPNASTITSGRTALILSAILVAGVLFSLWVLSPSYLEIAIAHKAEAAASRIYRRKKAVEPTASPAAAKAPAVAVVDESGEDAELPTKIWSNLKDGQNYRTRLNGELLSLEVIGNTTKGAGEITKCEFHRTAGGAPSWVGICSERDLRGEAERDSMASLSQFSDTRLEGSTGDIPVFVMTPVENVIVGAPPTPATVTPQMAPPVGPPAEGEIIAEPDLSGLKSADRESIEATCASDKLTGGTEKYNECLRKQINELKQAPKPRGFSKLSSMDRDAVEFACTTARLTQGPGAYNQCLAKQMAIVKKKKP